jgi:hypothetical protein
MKIAFHINKLCVTGISVALYDYALYNEKLYNNTSIILIPEKSIADCEPIALNKFSKRFLVRTYKDLEETLSCLKCDILYCIKYGINDGIYSKNIKTVIHCVYDMTDSHGNIYAGISCNLIKKFNKHLFVPYMVSLKKIHNNNLKILLGIPNDAIVFGRYGSIYTFNIPWISKVIEKIVKTRHDIYFLLNNTVLFDYHPQIKYYKNIVSEDDKNKFINTCDAYIECGTIGHSFGLAIAEFSTFNKPIIAYNGQDIQNTAHFDVLKDNALYFQDEKQFKSLLNNFKKEDYIDKDLNFYKEYTPENVMKKFNEVFLTE